MKLQDFFTRVIKDKAKINNADFDKFIASLPDGEFPDELVPEFENNFMTMDRAIAHPDVNKKLRFQILNPVEERVQGLIELIDKIDPHTAIELSKLTRTTASGQVVADTYKTLEALRDVIPKIIEKKTKISTSDEELKKQLAAKEQSIAELMEKFTKVENEYKTKEKTIASEYDQKYKNFRLESELEKRANKFTFAEHFDKDDVRGVLTKAKLSELKGSNILQLVENNGKEDVQVFSIGADGNPTPRFNGNTPVTIDSLLEEAFKPYLKQSNAGAPHNGTQTTTTRTYPTNDTGTAPRQGRSTAVV
jgi:hypothetical protein